MSLKAAHASISVHLSVEDFLSSLSSAAHAEFLPPGLNSQLPHFGWAKHFCFPPPPPPLFFYMESIGLDQVHVSEKIIIAPLQFQCLIQMTSL